MEEAARWLDGNKNSNKTAAIAATSPVQTGIDGNGNGRGSDRQHKLDVNIAMNWKRRDDINGGSDGVGASLAWFGGSGW